MPVYSDWRIYILFDYTGYECKSCGEKFTDGDDIVVCPDCGTPYHRECYNREGQCINTELHQKNVSWKSEQAANDNELPSKCTRCGVNLRSDQLFCDNCGTPTEYFIKKKGVAIYRQSAKENNDYSDLYNGNNDDTERINQTIYPYLINFSDPLCGFNPNEEIEDGVTMQDMGDYVSTNTHYYLPKFKLMKTGKFKMSMNFSAFLFPEFYFANRKMPIVALIIMLVKTAIDLPQNALAFQTMLTDPKYAEYFNKSFPEMINWLSSLLTQYPLLAQKVEHFKSINFNTESFNNLYNFSAVLSTLLMIFCTGFSTYIYYRLSVSKIAKIKRKSNENSANLSERLKSSGGTSPITLAVFIGLSFFMSYFSLAAILFIF